MPSVMVPAERVVRWVENFEERHGAATLEAEGGALTGVAADGSTFRARLPFASSYAGEPGAAAFLDSLRVPDAWGMLLVRKGGFAIARLSGPTITDSKVGQRHVQGRTKAGGQSQQRFARRRDNQARQAYEAAAEHAARILGGLTGMVVTGGDRPAVDEVLADPRLRRLTPVGPWLAVPDPRRGVLEQAVRDACAVQMEVRNAEQPRSS
jgi:hypothetical protein